MKTRLFLVPVILVLIAQAGLTAGTGENSSTSGGKSGAEGVSITFWNGFTASDGDILREIFDRFNEENKDSIDVKMDIMPWANMLEKLAVSVSTQTGPTLILLGIENIPEYSESGALLPLDDFREWSDLDKSNYAANVLETFMYKGRPLNRTALVLMSI